MLEDLAAGIVNTPTDASADGVAAFIKSRQPDYFSFADWEALDAQEIAKGEAQGRPRVKFTDIPAMVQAVK